MTGYLLGVALAGCWWGAGFRPPFARLAGLLACAALGGALIAGFVFVPGQLPAHAARAAKLIPTAELPTSGQNGLARARDLVARYPKDPRGHLLQAADYLNARNLSGAEREFREALTLLPDPAKAPGNPARELAETYLAVTLAAENQWAEAIQLAGPICANAKNAANRQVLVKARLCSGEMPTEPAEKRLQRWLSTRRRASRISAP